MKRLLVAALCMALAGCANIPLGTIWKMASFSRDDLILIDPAIIGTAVELPDSVPLNRDEIELRVEVHPENPPENAEPILQLRSALRLRDSGRDVHPQLPITGHDRSWYLLALSDDGIAAFRKFQKEFATLLANDEREYFFSLFVYNTFTTPDALNEPFETSVWLNLDDPEDWFPLIDRYAFDPSDLQRDTEAQPAGGL